MSEVAERRQESETTRDLVKYNVSDGVALLTLNDPPANTYSYEMMQALDRAILSARMDDAAQVIVITGNGEKFFCAGADIQMCLLYTSDAADERSSVDLGGRRII